MCVFKWIYMCEYTHSCIALTPLPTANTVHISKTIFPFLSVSTLSFSVLLDNQSEFPYNQRLWTAVLETVPSFRTSVIVWDCSAASSRKQQSRTWRWGSPFFFQSENRVCYHVMHTFLHKEHVFTCLFSLCMSSFERYLFSPIPNKAFSWLLVKDLLYFHKGRDITKKNT